MAGNVAFITGGGSGIARAASVIFAREGAKVAIAEIKPELGRATENAVNDAGGDALFIETDVTKEDSVKRAVAQTMQRFGKLDVLYNCAGGSVPEDSLVTDVDLNVWNRTMILNLYRTPDKPGRIVDRQDATGRVTEYPFWVGQPEDIANIALFLASDESRMITGASIPADGGRSAY